MERVMRPDSLLDSDEYQLTLYVLGTVVLVLILFTNVTLLVLVARYRRLRTRSTLPVVSWAVVDLCASIILLTQLTMSKLAWTPKTSYYLCVLWACIQVVPVVGSFNHMILLTLDRYIAVLFPMRYEIILSYRRLYGCIGASWFYSLLICCIPMLWNDTYDHQYHYCTMSIFPRFYPILPLVHCIVAVVTSVGMYCKILTVVRRHQRQVHVTNTMTQEQLMAEVRITNVYCSISGMFTVTWLPFLITWLLSVIFSYPTESLWMSLIVCYLIGTINSASKVILYFVFHDDIQESLRELYTKHPSPRMTFPSVRRNP